ncbi:MAG: tRNA (guanosine(37)-N1)-methyltransferase TrmD [Acidiferrobacterales bacterium]|nr:tRNA (guanosine(37)-N1)-methyltransferase TrmD [Acidiferrobacterales bacterium]
MRISVVTIFPQMFHAVADYGVVGRAVKNNLVDFAPIDLRSFGQGNHRHLDDRPFGGGPGMVMLAEPIVECINQLKQGAKNDTTVIYLSPQGKKVAHKDICEFAGLSELIFLCGRYEGIDQRALDIIGAQEVSIGDYVLSGGELAAMVLIDAIVRQIPGVLGNDQSSTQESFADGLLDCIHYTRPKVVDGHEVPAVLLSGDHEAIRYWRLKQSIGRTWLLRPDLLDGQDLSSEQQRALAEFQEEHDKEQT